jgi:asparagine synthase (glutamine-hydrolysing)
MSAIAGIIRFDEQSVNPETVNHIQIALKPYGPDVQRHWATRHTSFLHNLLRITPEDYFDHQPLTHPLSGTTVLFDGRIDNRDELSHLLGFTAEEIATMADSTLVLQACLNWGTKVVDYLLGDFALACWQANQRKLWLARDPMGTRPLFWHQNNHFFAFATMPKGLFAIPGISKDLCEEFLYEYLCQYSSRTPRTFFKDIYRIEPGQLLILEDGHITKHRYHQFDPSQRIRLANDTEYLEAFREQLDRAVSCRLRSSTLVSSELSSGFDSSTVTAVAASQLVAQNKKLVSYTAVPRKGFSGPVPRGYHGDESKGAGALTARFPNIKHVLIRPDYDKFFENLNHDTELLDHPPHSPIDMVWVNEIRRDMLQHSSKVLLGGANGNISISYDGLEYLPLLLRNGQWLTLWREFKAIQLKRPTVSRKQLVRTYIIPYLRAVWQSVARSDLSQIFPPSQYSPINPSFWALMHTSPAVYQPQHRLSLLWKNTRHSRAEALNRIDIGEYFAADNARGIERRDPTADRRLCEFCLAIPENLYLRHGQFRWILCQLMGTILPYEILQANTQGIQSADWFECIEVNLQPIRASLESPFFSKTIDRYIDLPFMLHALNKWPQARWEKPETRLIYKNKLIQGLSVGHFIERLSH